VQGRHAHAVPGVDLRAAREQKFRGFGASVEGRHVEWGSAQGVGHIDFGSGFQQSFDLHQIATYGGLCQWRSSGRDIVDGVPLRALLLPRCSGSLLQALSASASTQMVTSDAAR
jgi:hypothetical protein